MKNRFSMTILQNSKRILLFAILLFCGEAHISAQAFRDTDNRTEQNLKSAARVNPSTLAMEFSLPLMSYPGRGGNSFPVTFNYSSKLWTMRYFDFINPTIKTDIQGGTGSQQDPYRMSIITSYLTQFSERAYSGWNVSGMQPMAQMENDGSFDFKDEFGNRFIRYISRVRIQMPDGSTKEFRLNDKLYNCSGFQTNDDCNNIYSTSGTYLAADGSGMRYVPGTQASPEGKIYLPDGGLYKFTYPGSGYTYIDRNGNKTVYDQATNKITDTLGREITNPLPGDNSFNLPGLSGQNLTYGKKWQPLKPAGCVTGTEAACQDAGLENPSDALYYLDNDTCEDQNWDHPINSSGPFLFEVYPPREETRIEQVNNVPVYYKDTYKDRMCYSSGAYPINPNVLTEITLPNGGKYKFRYNRFGEMTKIIYPTGAYERFRYDEIGMTYAAFPFNHLSRGVVERWVSEDGVTETQNWKYGIQTAGYDQNGLTFNAISTIAPDGTKTLRTIHNPGASFMYYEDPRSGMPLEEKTYSPPSVPNNEQTRTLLRRQLTEWQNADPRPGGNIPRDARPVKTISISFEPNASYALAVMQKTVYETPGQNNAPSDPEYFAHLNAKRVETYGYVTLDLTTAQTATIEQISALFTNTNLASVSETDYLYDANYKERHIFGLPTETRVLNPANQTEVLAKSQFVYDEQNQYYSTADYGSTTGYEAPTGTYASLRGNATTLKTWNKDDNSWIEVHRQFDNFGNLRKAWDSSGDQTRFVETEYASQYYYAYPTKVITPAPDPNGTHGTSESSNAVTTYDFSTGLPLTATNANGQTTSVEYDDFLRPKRVTPPAGGAISEREYSNTPGNLYVKSRTQVDAQHWAESTTFLDNLGRAYKTQTKDLQGDIFAEMQYDSLGRVKQVSNPYRQGEQKLWSKPRYDNIGRVVETYAPAPDGQTGTSNGIVQYGISTVPGFVGNYTEATDASGRKARSLTNVFGQVVRVDEPKDNNTDLGTLDTPTQASYYSYNVKGELIKTQQGQQNRYFKYDSLGRLTRVRQPEQTPNSNLATTGNPENNQWTMGYTYDIFDNVLTVTDAKNTVITNDYDKAGRVKTTSYSDGTPQIDYFYDGTGLGLSQLPQFAKGNLTKISNGVSETRYTSFDNYGRVLANNQFTDGRTYNFSYKYDDYGNLTEETYPSERVVKTLLDADGGLAAVSSKTANSAYKTYASNFDYSATGAIKAMMIGNGRWETAQFNSRQQLTQIGLGSSATDTSLWKTNYDYGELNQDGSVDASKNIGNIAKQTITLPSATFVQTFKYDALNRLKEAKETAGTVTGAENWKQTFDYDRYGNRTGFYQKVGNDVLPINNQTLPTVDPATNRFSTGQGYTYDFNGNLVQDAQNRGFTYNGEDRQTVVRDLNISTSQSNPDANVIGKYYYDGSGQRVKKVTNTEITIFVYDGGGTLAAEYSTAPQPQNPTISYLTTDRLGSPRVITDKQGNVISRRDFMPFGEEITAGIGGRDTINQKYSIPGRDNIRQRFTGYEKDEETDLDFAQARMYQNKHGRFTAPDPLLSSASLSNPQTFNRYAYTGNNPVNITDPSGLKWCASGDTYRTADVCNSSEEDADNRVVQVTQVGPEFAAGGARVGDIIQLRPDNSLKVLLRGHQAAAVAAKTGTTIHAAADPIVATGDVPISSNISSRSPDGLPPCPICGSADNVYTTPIDTSKNEPLPQVEAVAKLAELCSMVPGVGTPCAVIATITRTGQGDFSGAAGNAIGLIPFGKLFSKLKRLKVAEEVIEDAEKVAPCLLCFVAGTEVQTMDGLKPIEEIKIGDKVLSYNEQTQQNEYQLVYNTFRRFADDIYAINIENEEKTLEVTSEHPFYIKIHQARDNLSSDDEEGEWVRVRDLEAGDEIRLASGSWAKILDIKFKGAGEVFNFSVANNNNYYVGNSRLLTHNTGCNPISLTTSSTSNAASRRYTIYTADGELYKFGVTDENLVRMNQSLAEAGPGATAKYTGVVTKQEAHIAEKYIRSLQYKSTGQYRLPGMKYPYPVDLITGIKIKPPN